MMKMVITPFRELGLDLDKFFINNHTQVAYPPFNIIKRDEDNVVLEFALAGFGKEHVSVSTEKNVLTLKGEKTEETFDDGAGYLHKGIATRKFVRSFSLPEWFEVKEASMSDGILTVSLVRNVPEQHKPKEITIS
jgi:molecular chaperone IbpA